MNYRHLLSILLIVCTVQARVIDVSEFGIVPGVDVTMKVNDLVRSVKNEANVSLHFPEGQYDFYPDNAEEIYRTVPNHDNGLKRMAFPLFGHENLTIEGNGSVFMFHGRMVPFTLEGVNKASLKNFTIDFIRPFHTELTVVERDEDSQTVVLEFDPEQYPYRVIRGEIFFDRLGQNDAFIGQNILFDPTTRAPIHLAQEYRMTPPSLRVEQIGHGRLRLTRAFNKLPPVGSVLILYGINPTSRLVHAIQVNASKDILIENVTIHAAGGMGLIVERTENVTLDEMKVTSTDGRLISTRADATHFIGCKGLIEVKNCLFEHMLDDAINVHGAYVPVVEHLHGQTLLCEISHFQQWGLTFAEPGDKVALLSRETVLPFFETTVVDVRKLNEQRFLITLEELPEDLPDVPLSIENLTWNPDLIMRNNKVRENRARSVLVTTKGSVLIEDNYFASHMHGILIEGDNLYWYESGAVKDVMIRNNTFENIGFGATWGYPLLASPKLSADQVIGEGRYHRNIRFIGNTIRSFNGHTVNAKSVENLTIKDNKIEFSTDYPKAALHPAIRLDYCRDVRIEGNTASAFPERLSVEVSPDSEGILWGETPGFNNFSIRTDD